MGRIRLAKLAFVVAMLAPLQAFASFHLWQIKEVYTNSSGTIQYVELFTSSAGQTFLSGHTLTATDGTTTHTFTFPSDLAGDTTNKTLLIATPGFKNASGVTPDFTLPCGQFFNPSATTIQIDFAMLVTPEAVMFQGSTIPKNGTDALRDGNLGGTPALTSVTAAPKNYAGVAGSLSAATNTSTANQVCDDGLFCNGTETCSGSACTATAPCAQQCIEPDQCVECLNATNCNDNNPCTDDTCDGAHTCQHAAHVGSCDDGLFCNGADTCSGTTCTHAGTPCGAQNCNEAPDTCGDCQSAADCDEGEPCTIDTCDTGACHRTNAADGAECDNNSTYCDGVGTCTSAVCGGIAVPCDPATSMCLENSKACSPLDAPPDASGPGDNGDGGGGGCCQANATPATLTSPLLVLALGLLVGRRRRRRT